MPLPQIALNGIYSLYSAWQPSAISGGLVNDGTTTIIAVAKSSGFLSAEKLATTKVSGYVSGATTQLGSYRIDYDETTEDVTITTGWSSLAFAKWTLQRSADDSSIVQAVIKDTNTGVTIGILSVAATAQINSPLKGSLSGYITIGEQYVPITVPAVATQAGEVDPSIETWGDLVDQALSVSLQGSINNQILNLGNKTASMSFALLGTPEDTVLSLDGKTRALLGAKVDNGVFAGNLLTAFSLGY